MTDGSGQVLEAGYGNVPQGLAKRYRGRLDTKVVQQRTVRSSNLTRWEVRAQDGKILASGDGQPPADLFQVRSLGASLSSHLEFVFLHNDL